jgi:hypothetical protein
MRFTEFISEAGSPAQQAAIAVAMKKAGKKPKGVTEGLMGSHFVRRGDPEAYLDKMRSIHKTLTKGGYKPGGYASSRALSEPYQSAHYIHSTNPDTHPDVSVDRVGNQGHIHVSMKKSKPVNLPEQGTTEATGDAKFDSMLGNIVKDTPMDFVLSDPQSGVLFKRGFKSKEQAKAYNQKKERGYYSVYSYQWWRDTIKPEIPDFYRKQGVAESVPKIDVKKQISKFEELALAANRAGDDAKCKQYQQKIQSLKQKMSQGVAEGLQEINWVKPNFDFEWHEVEEQSRMKQVPDDVRQYYQKHFPNKDAWLKAVQNGKAVVVPPDHAYEIRNAPFDKASLQKVLAPTGHEGPIGPAKEKRVNDLFDKGQVEMPIILKTSQGLWLIGGKTRLGTANYVKGLPAKIWLISGEQGVAEGENWSKHNNKRVGGMSKKSVSSYRRSHPGSKIQTAVTTKPSKLKKGSKAAARRKSFCARMKGMKKHRTGAKTAHDPNSNINKSLRRWHCESIEELHELVMLAEQFIRNNKK